MRQYGGGFGPQNGSANKQNHHPVARLPSSSIKGEGLGYVSGHQIPIPLPRYLHCEAQ